ncbi:hypothetical protein MAR_002642 [Mya arenaria]|uniref:Uncharacterized protein n=1 Tax=Mya arenaria TaxID=6604 RepID=A0ABY7G6U0_MYAAR|nr:hypothetical protein MAR_002642 [Mya arenaria]
MEEDPAIQIEKFKFEPNSDNPNSLWPESYKADKTWDIRFKAKAKKITDAERPVRQDYNEYGTDGNSL